MQKFEVGKVYRSRATKIKSTCLAATNTMAIMTRLENMEFALLHEYFKYYEEVETKKVIEGWLNIYKPLPGTVTYSCYIHPTKEQADKYGGARIDCIPFRYEYEEK